MHRDVYSGFAKLEGAEDADTLQAASNYAASLRPLERFEEIKALMLKNIPIARRVLGDESTLVFRMKKIYGNSLYSDPGATLDDLCEAVTMLEETERIARRVLGSAHPTTDSIEDDLQGARAALRAREETQPSPGSG